MSFEPAVHPEESALRNGPPGPFDRDRPRVTDQYPLTHGQRALWFLQKLAPDTAAYNVAYGVWLPKGVDLGILCRALGRVAERHAAVRTIFPVADPAGEPVQQVLDNAGFELRLEDATALSREALNERIAEEVYRPFHLETGPLARVTFFALPGSRYIAIPVLHHSITDLWSMALFIRDLAVFYGSEQSGAPPALRPLRGRYSDNVRREQEMLSGPEGERLASYWKRQLSGDLPVLNLPTDRPRPPVQTFRGGSCSVVLDSRVKTALEGVAAASSASLHSLCLAAFFVLLYRYSGQTDILIGEPKSCRSFSLAESMGYFINPVVMRADLSGNPRFSSLLDQVHRTAADGFAHGDYPFSLLVQQLRAAPDPSRPALHQVALAWQKTTKQVGMQIASFALNESGGKLGNEAFELESLALDHRPAPLDMTLHMAEMANSLGATLEYNQYLFNKDSAGRMLGHFRNLLESIAAGPEQRISALRLLDDGESRRILVEWNRTRDDAPLDTPVHRIFEAQAGRTPHAVALACGARRMTYAELDDCSSRVAARLQALGVGPDVLAAVCLERSVEMIVALLGVMKAGGAYLPLDPNYPAERLQFMLEDSRARVLITHSSLLHRLPEVSGRTLLIDSLPGQAPPLVRPRLSPDNLAYAIYTSGSTGTPKGVLLHHRGLTNLVLAQTRGFGLTPQSRVLQFASFSFDASVSEIFMALTTGAALYLAPAETLLSPSGLVRLMQEEEITTITLPPSFLTMVAPEQLPHLSCLISAGEACPWDLALRWRQGRRFFNAYGPTETTIGPAYHEVTGMVEGTHSVPVGRPIANTRFYILDEHLTPVPEGAAGELYIGGAGLARGYLNQPAATAEKFLPDPFADTPGSRLYRTGDLARYLPGGAVELLGRVDHQVKVRGFRIELSEIEAALENQPGVLSAVVLAREGSRGERYLAAYVVPADPLLDAAKLRASLKRRLPDYMVPAWIVILDKLPLTANGKVDRKALPDPRTLPGAGSDTSGPPRNELERTIAAIWADALEIPKVGIHDNFFDLGGHSLLIPRVHAAIQDRLGRELPMTDLFRHPTVAALAECIARGESEPAVAAAVHRRARQQREALERQRMRPRRAVPYPAKEGGDGR